MNTPASIGRYDIVGELARGGMSQILLGRITGAHGFLRLVVLKRMLWHLAESTSFRNMMVDEARIAARISHPNVVHVEEFLEHEGNLVLVFEYLLGESLDVLWRRCYATHDPMAPLLAAHIIAEACAGLHAAHELCDDAETSLGVVHRDVSPSNIFITFDAHVKVLDFGIALIRGRTSNTRTGELKGKLGYMSPEQCQGRPLDRRTDVFSLGVVLYQLLANCKLFDRNNAAANIRAIVDEPIIPLSRIADVPRELDDACMRALEKSPDDRFQTADAFRLELKRVLANLDPHAMASEQLRSLMLRLLGDRYAVKHALVTEAKRGLAPPMPSSEVEPDARIPDITEVMPPLGVGAQAHRTRNANEPRGWAPAPRSLLRTSVLAATILGAIFGGYRFVRPRSAPEPVLDVSRGLSTVVARAHDVEPTPASMDASPRATPKVVPTQISVQTTPSTHGLGSPKPTVRPLASGTPIPVATPEPNTSPNPFVRW